MFTIILRHVRKLNLTVDNERFSNFLFTAKLKRFKLLLAPGLIVIYYHNHNNCTIFYLQVDLFNLTITTMLLPHHTFFCLNLRHKIYIIPSTAYFTKCTNMSSSL